MSEANPLHLYPHADLEGTPLPYEILFQPGYIRQAFTGTVSGAVTLPSGGELLVFLATENCYVSFDGTAAIPADGAHVEKLCYVPASNMLSVDPNGAVNFTVIRDTADGTLHVYTTKRWRSGKPAQNFSNR